MHKHIRTTYRILKELTETVEYDSPWCGYELNKRDIKRILEDLNELQVKLGGEDIATLLSH